MPIIINSKFRPFSYQEMLQPVLMATQAHQALEDQYAELDTKTSMWEKLKDSAIDRDVYQQYKAYSDALKASSDELAQFGLTPSSRRAMLDMRARYSKDITPIEQAWNERDRQMKVQQEMMLKDPTHMYRVNANQVGLREYMRGNYDALTDNYSGALLTQQVSQQAQALAKELRNYGRGKPLDSFTNTFLKNHGFSSGQVLNAINNPNDKNSSMVLNAIVDSVIGASGIGNWNDETTLKRAYDYARQGLWSAVGTSDVSTFENYGARLAAQEEKEKRVKAYKAQGEELPQYARTQLRGNPYNLDYRLDVNKSQKVHNDYSKYFDRNGNLTKEGLKEYNKLEDTYKISSGTIKTGYKTQGPSSFKRFMDNLNGGKPITTQTKWGPWAAKKFGNLYRQNAARLESEGVLNADTYRNKAFDVQFKNQDIVKQALTSGKNNGVVPVQEYTREGYKGTGTVDLNNEEFKNATFAGEYGLQGNFIVITTTKGKQYRVPLSTVNSSLDDAIKASLSGSEELYYRNRKQGIRYTDEELNSVINTGRGYTTIQDEINKLLNSALDNFVAAFEQVQSEPYKVSGGLH